MGGLRDDQARERTGMMDEELRMGRGLHAAAVGRGFERAGSPTARSSPSLLVQNGTFTASEMVLSPKLSASMLEVQPTTNSIVCAQTCAPKMRSSLFSNARNLWQEMDMDPTRSAHARQRSRRVDELAASHRS